MKNNMKGHYMIKSSIHDFEKITGEILLSQNCIFEALLTPPLQNKQYNRRKFTDL